MSAEWADQPPVDNHGVPGRTLAAQREAMGWSVEQVAEQLKLAVRQVVALEAGDYASLPGPAVVRGFVRAYAKVVKLDAAPLVAMIALDTPAPSDATSTTVRRDKPASFSEVRFPTNGKRASKLPFALIGGAFLLAGIAAVAWQFGVIPASLLGGGQATPPAAANGQASVTTLPAPLTTVPQAEPAPA
ncbi:MAG: helix-turn-helix domain-containing protein, partial [Pseudomonadota bacterium]